MTVYFTSDPPAWLRLGGEYAGVIDGFVRRAELAFEQPLPVEAYPGNNFSPLNFFMDEAFFASPPDFARVYLMGGDALVRLFGYPPKDCALRPLAQTRFFDNLVTLCSRGGVVLCRERPGDVRLFELPSGFASAGFESGKIGGFPVLFIYCEGGLAVLSQQGDLIFNDGVKSYSQGDMLGVTRAFETCAGAVAESFYSYDGNALSLVSSRTAFTRPVPPESRHFAFFESVLTHGDSSVYLNAELRARADELGGYLGDFAEVLVPPRKFYDLTGERLAAGLAYPLSSNLYRVKFYAADTADGLVCNVRSVDYPPRTAQVARS